MGATSARAPASSRRDLQCGHCLDAPAGPSSPLARLSSHPPCSLCSKISRSRLPSIPPGPRTPLGLPEPRPSDHHPVPARPRPGFAQAKQEMRCSRSVSLLRNCSAEDVSCIPHSASRPSWGPGMGVLTASPYSSAWRTSDSAGRRRRGWARQPSSSPGRITATHWSAHPLHLGFSEL